MRYNFDMPHKPNFRNEFNEWWYDKDRPKHSSLIISFFRYSYEKGWIPKEALQPLYPIGVLFATCIVMLFIGPFPNFIIGISAFGILICLAWLLFTVGRYCRLALIEIVFLMLPVALLVWGNLLA